jgi:hypothetical protein
VRWPARAGEAVARDAKRSRLRLVLSRLAHGFLSDRIKVLIPLSLPVPIASMSNDSSSS